MRRTNRSDTPQTEAPVFMTALPSEWTPEWEEFLARLLAGDSWAEAIAALEGPPPRPETEDADA